MNEHPYPLEGSGFVDRNNRKNAIFQDIGGVFTHHFIFSQQ